MTRWLTLLGAGMLACSEGGAAAEQLNTLDGSTAHESRAPMLVDSFPLAHARDVYPSPFGDGRQQGFQLWLLFSTPMNESVERLRFGPRSQAQSPQQVQWSADRHELRITIAPPPLAAQSLLDDTEYELDLNPVRSAAGESLAQVYSLQGAKLRFTTGRYDALLNHSCGHTVFGPFASGSASSEPVLDGSAELVLDTTHTQYTIELSETPELAFGYVNLRLAAPSTYRLYFDQAVRLSVLQPSGLEELPVVPTPASCVGIRAQADLEIHAAVGAGTAIGTLRLDAQSHKRVNVIVEAVSP